MFPMKTLVASFVAITIVAGVLPFAPAHPANLGPTQEAWDTVAQKAAKFLQGTQDKNGGWSTDKTPGVTGVALTGLLKAGQATPQDPVAQKALKFIENLVNPEKKHIAGKGDAKVQLHNYVTAINVMALVEANQ